MRDGTVGIGLIGLGQVSFSHEPGYVEMPDACRIVAVCDINADTASSRAAMCDARACTRYQDLLADPDVDAVDITVPHHLHYQVALAAIEQGKHVLLEKPIAVDSRQGMDLVERARAAGVTFTVAENTRFVSAYLAAKRLLEQGALGDVWIVRTLIAGSEVHRLRNPHGWLGKAPHGGVILDSAVHSFYLLKWLFGGVRDVLGFASKIVPEGEAEDNGLVLGHLANGAEFQLNVSCTMEIPWTERLEVYGSRGGMIVDQLANPVVKFYLGSDDIDGTVAEDVPFEPLAWKFNSILAEVRDFVSAIIERRAPLVDPTDAVYAVRAVEAVHRSIVLHQLVTL